MSKSNYVRLTTFGKIFPIILVLGIVGGVKVYNFVMSPVRALNQAFEEMNLEKLEWAIEQRVNVDTFVQGVRPVFLAFKKGSHEFMEVLAEAGADINLSTKYGSFVGYVAQQGDTTALDILGQHGASFYYNADTLGHNVLSYALVNKKTELVPTIMKYTKRNVHDGNGKTPLHYADHIDNDMIQYLVTAGENPNATDKQGNRPLHTVNSIRTVKVLHEQGADINAVNDCNTPAIFYQVANGNGRTYNYMAQHGALTNQIDGYDQSILTYALMTDNERLHRQVSEDLCKFYPEICTTQQKKLKSSAIKAMTTLVYTKTIHKAAMKRLAAAQAAKAAARNAIIRGVGKRALLKGIPIIGWASAAYDVKELAEATAKHNTIIRQHREEAERLQKEREIAVHQLRDEYMNCYGQKENQTIVAVR